MCLGGIRQRIRASNPDGELPSLYPVHELFEITRVFFVIGTSIRAGEKQRSLFLELHEIKRRNVAARLSVDHKIAAGSKAVEASLKCIFANSIENHADPAASSDP